MSLNKSLLYPDFSKGAQNAAAVIFSVAGQTVSDDERALFKSCNPLGFILFARNCENPKQLKGLTDDLKAILGRDCPILIDQEGGRVQRLKPPHWRTHPPCNTYGDVAAAGDIEQALTDCRFRTLRIAEELIDCGINVNCDPVMDVHFDGAHDVIGDRAFSHDPALVGRLGESVCRQYIAAGIVPIIKHIPGHGRAGADSHHELPRVDTPRDDLERVDFAPFKHIAQTPDIANKTWAMMAHIIYDALDDQHPASVSKTVIARDIRGVIGFNGFLVADDASMKALDAYGDVAARCVASLNAGCDAALYCAGDINDMRAIADIVPPLTTKALARLALDRIKL